MNRKTFFSLKRATAYAVVGAGGAPIYCFLRGRPLAVSWPEDIRRVRAQADLLYDCDEDGLALTANDPPAASGDPPRPSAVPPCTRRVGGPVEERLP
jgi:hypothetical protein